MARDDVDDVEVHAIDACTVEALPAEVLAAAELTLKVRVSCSGSCDLRGQPLLILERDDILIEKVELTEFTSGMNLGSALIVKAPDAPGTYTWTALCPAHEKEGVLHEEARVSFSFTVKAHPTTVSVWGVPPAIAAGGKVSFKVGMTCAAHCKLTNREFQIVDQQGTQVAHGLLGADAWPATTALYFTEVELRAPTNEGHYSYEARAPGITWELPHEGDSCTFRLRVVRPPECMVTVVAVDKDDHIPIKGAHVVMHPYRAFTDENGVAVLSVPKGEYKLHVSGFRYAAFHTTVEVTGDVTHNAELYWQPHLDEDELSATPMDRERTRLQRAAREKEQIRARQNRRP